MVKLVRLRMLLSESERRVWEQLKNSEASTSPAPQGVIAGWYVGPFASSSVPNI